jgi:hypothetical protein
MVANIMSQDKIKEEILYPCLTPVKLPLDQIVANDYNPNRMPDREMTMLKIAFKNMGFSFPS